MIFETPHEQDQYILKEGRWYKTSKDFAEEVDGYVRDLFEEGEKAKEVILPNAREDEKEAEYSQRVARKEKYLLMDARDVRASAKEQSNVEMCDMLKPSRHLIHLKPGNASCILSHLFVQGKASDKILQCDPDYRLRVNMKFLRAELIEGCKTHFGESLMNTDFKNSLNLICKDATEKTCLISKLITTCKRKLKKKFTREIQKNLTGQCKKNKNVFEKIIPSTNFNPKDFTIVYGIIYQKSSMNDVCEVIPFFSRLNPLIIFREKINLHRATSP